MSKLSQIKNIVQEAKELVEDVQSRLSEKIEEYNIAVTEYNDLKEAIAIGELGRIQKSLESLQNLPESLEVVAIECQEKVQTLEPQKPLEIEEPRSGTFGAKFWGFIVAVIIFLGFGAVGAYFKKLNFDVIDMKFFEQAFGFYSDIITGTSGSAPVLGITIAGAIAIVVGYIVYLVLINKAAASNLERAQEIFEEAKNYAHDKEILMQQLQKIKEFLDSAIEELKAAKVFATEFSAKLERIKFFEGIDFENFAQPSKEDVQLLLGLKNALDTIVQSELCKEDEDISDEVKVLFENLGNEIEKLKRRVYG